MGLASVARDERFEFGKNWSRFLSVLDDGRIAAARRSLTDMLAVEDLQGRSFLDVGSGSGLFSLAARSLGAARVHSFDYDPQSVACTRELKRRHFPDDAQWTIDEGSALDRKYVHSLGAFDIVYSWGVLHHTGDMWTGLRNVAQTVKPAGSLFVALYNDQGLKSRRWTAIKRFYNRSPGPVRMSLVLGVGSWFVLRGVLVRLHKFENPLGVLSRLSRQGDRGMFWWHDLVDWVGGYPFEVAKPDDVIPFFQSRGFTLQRMVSAGSGHGNNEFVFVKDAT